jgi:hypothetical protein
MGPIVLREHSVCDPWKLVFHFMACNLFLHFQPMLVSFFIIFLLFLLCLQTYCIFLPIASVYALKTILGIKLRRKKGNNQVISEQTETRYITTFLKNFLPTSSLP